MNREDAKTEEFRYRFHAPSDTEFLVELGYETVRLDKIFGPLIFMDLRIRADAESCEWVIEQQCLIHDKEGNFVCTDWKERARIEGQPEDSGLTG